jgi:RNA 3'-terminal phosphate cyclase (ATP)
MLLAGRGGLATSLGRRALSADVAQHPAESVRSVLRLRGGTDASMAPPVGYAQHVLVPLLRSKLGVNVTLNVVRRGFYPKARQSESSVIVCMLRLIALHRQALSWLCTCPKGVQQALVGTA